MSAGTDAAIEAINDIAQRISQAIFEVELSGAPNAADAIDYLFNARADLVFAERALQKGDA